MRSTRERRIVGAMTGTSIDGIDVALVRVQGTGREMHATLVRHASHDLGPLAAELRAAAEQRPLPASRFAVLAHDLGQLHADAIESLIENASKPDLVAVHGQTVFHAPPHTWQIIDSAPIAARLGCPVVTDLRRDDCAHGGDGAPITPLADWVLFRAPAARAIVNLGGYVNATILPPDDEAGDAASDAAPPAILGFDVCACNHVLDGIARTLLGAPYDEGGRAAVAGTIDEARASALADHLRAQTGANRSLGTGDEATECLADLASLTPADAAATAVAAIASCLCAALRPHAPKEILVAGGSAANAALIAAIERACEIPVHRTDVAGVPAVAREAVAMAVLGALTADGVPITLPAITGCLAPAPRAGRWTLPSHVQIP